MPEVSIILPTYNRADSIERAIESVRQQTFEDWELIIVNDGSTDNTAALVSNRDPRIRLLQQDNRGCYVARNAGLAASRGRFITFLDSDDEWLPHFLALTINFLRWSPEDHFVTTEFLEDWNDGNKLRHDLHEIGTAYPTMAKAINSQMLDLPVGTTDDYLRVYDSREPVGAWGSQIVKLVGYTEAFLYRGHIFEHMRWGYLNWLPVTVITRHALETVGPFVTYCRNAADYRFLALLAHSFRANMIAIPSAIKHSLAPDAQELAHGHLATGNSQYTFSVNRLKFFDELYWNHNQEDPELNAIRSYNLFHVGRSALRLGQRQDALFYLQAAASSQQYQWRTYALRLFAHLFPSDRAAATAYRLILRLQDILHRFATGHLSPVSALRKGLLLILHGFES